MGAVEEGRNLGSGMRTRYLLPFFLLFLTSCCTSKKCQLERVAKDWCMTIRASQVIPVYPLTEDVQPGDVFLVRTRIEDQASEYERRGFLPLDQLLARFQPTNYQQFYL